MEDENLFVRDDDDVVMDGVEESVTAEDQESSAPVGEASESGPEEEEDDDPVVREFPVYSSAELGAKLRLLQYPTRAASRPLTGQSAVVAARMKTKAGIVEVDVPIETSRYYDEEKGQRWENADRQTFSGVMKKGQGRYMVGVFNNGALHLTSISSVAQLRPQFKYFDRHISAEKEATKAIKNSAETSKPREARSVQLSAKSSGEFAPKFSGALTARKLADEESFTPLDWYDRASDESWEIADKLVSSKTDVILESSTTLDEYTNMFEGSGTA